MQEQELELEISLRSLEAWRRLRSSHPWIADPASTHAIVAHASKHGIESAHLGVVAADEVRVTGSNYRENFHARGLNARQRAVLECLTQRLGDADPSALRIYAPEAVTPFARHMAECFPGFEGSEYLPHPLQRRRFPDVAHQDLTALDLTDACFDAVVCNEVFEHLADLDTALAEIARVTRHDGWLVSTFPFAYERGESLVKAARDGDAIRFVETPEYHEDPVSGERGALVFEIPGWDIIGRVEAAGFTAAEMVFCSSARRGLCARDLAGVFVLCARR
ncbi:MAG: class I SAM-dependent methyltransferase [bacterium]|nr:class I SAM-dependent methyltransferase [bacterium]